MWNTTAFLDLKIEFWVTNDSLPLAVLIANLFSTAAITTSSHYYIVYTYQLENWEYGFFSMAKKLTQAVWRHREATVARGIDLAFFLPLNSLTRRGKESWTKACLRAASKDLSNTGSDDWIPVIVDNPLARACTHTHTCTQVLDAKVNGTLSRHRNRFGLFWHLLQ